MATSESLKDWTQELVYENIEPVFVGTIYRVFGPEVEDMAKYISERSLMYTLLKEVGKEFTLSKFRFGKLSYSMKPLNLIMPSREITLDIMGNSSKYSRSRRFLQKDIEQISK